MEETILSESLPNSPRDREEPRVPVCFTVWGGDILSEPLPQQTARPRGTRSFCLLRGLKSRDSYYASNRPRFPTTAEIIQIPSVFQTLMNFDTRVSDMDLEFATRGPAVTQPAVPQLMYLTWILTSSSSTTMDFVVGFNRAAERLS